MVCYLNNRPEEHGDENLRQCSEADPRYLIGPYYVVPDGKVGHDAFAVVRNNPRDEQGRDRRVVLTNRKHIIALEPMDKGLSGTLLRYLTRCVLRTSISMQFRTSKSNGHA
jgi:non-homologous end joining protein Ku